MASSVWVFCVFILTVLALLLAITTKPKFTIPWFKHRTKLLTLQYFVPPLVGVFILLITVQMGFVRIFEAGLIGIGSGLKPYSIMLLILSMAFICISLDFTGFFSYVSFTLMKLVRTKFHLFTLLFIISAVFGCLASSHIVVMTLTPLIMSICHYTQISALPYLYTSFYASNLSSLLLIIGNPTNIIIADGFGISFFDFLKFMILPTIGVLGSGYVALLILFSNDMGLSAREVLSCGVLTRPDDQQEEEIFAAPTDTGVVTNQNDNNNSTSPSSTNPDPRQVLPDDVRHSQEQLTYNRSSMSNPFVQQELQRRRNRSTTRRSVVQTITMPQLRALDELKDPIGAAFHAVVLGFALAVMFLSSFISDSIQLYQISCCCALISLIYVVIRYPIFPSSTFSKGHKVGKKIQQKIAQLDGTQQANNNTNNNNNNPHDIESGYYGSNPTSPVAGKGGLKPPLQTKKKRQSLQMGVDGDTDGMLTTTEPIEPKFHYTGSTIEEGPVLVPPPQGQSGIPSNSSENNGSYGVMDTNNDSVNNNNNSQTTEENVNNTTSRPNSPSGYGYGDIPLDAMAETPQHDLEQLKQQTSRELCVWNIITSLPYDAPLFLFAMFVLVQALVDTEWIESFAYKLYAVCGGLGNIAEESLTIHTTLIARCIIIIVMFMAVYIVVSSLISGQPTAILLTQCIAVSIQLVVKYQIDMGYTEGLGLSRRYQLLMIYSFVAASNIGPLLTPVGSLGGILFQSMVNQRVAKNKTQYEIQTRAFQQRSTANSPTNNNNQNNNNNDDHALNINNNTNTATVNTDAVVDGTTTNTDVAAATDPNLTNPIFFDDRVTFAQFFFNGVRAVPIIGLCTCTCILISGLMFTDV